MSRIIYAIILFFLGWLIGLCVKDYGYFLYDSSFNLFECLYFVVSVAIAIYVAQRIEKGNQDYRNQKDIIITKIDETDETLKSLLNSFKANDLNRHEIKNVVIVGESKNISKLVNCYEKSIRDYYPTLFNSKEFHKIKTRKLVRICTLLPQIPSHDIRCSNDIWSYSEEKFVEIRNEIDSLRTLCFQNKLLLNGQ